MNNLKTIIAISFLCLVFLILPARAATIERVEISPEKIIQVAGSCLGADIAIHIFSAGTSSIPTASRDPRSFGIGTEPFYTAGGNCQEGIYFFKDDLGYWKFDAGDYRIKIYDANSPLVNPSNEEYFKIENILSYAPPTTTTETEAPSNSPQSPDDDEAKDREAPSGLLSRLIDAISDWFKNTAIMIKELITERITASEFCLGETCINENRLKDLLNEPEKADAPRDEHVVAPEEQNLSSASTTIEFSTSTVDISTSTLESTSTDDQIKE